MGCSTHKVPSWSKVAMRASGGTKVRPDPSTAARTKPMIVSLATPLFHDGSGSMPCAQPARTRGSDSMGRAATVVRTERRLMPERRGRDLIGLLPSWCEDFATAVVPESFKVIALAVGRFARMRTPLLRASAGQCMIRLVARVTGVGSLHLLQDLAQVVAF